MTWIRTSSPHVSILEFSEHFPTERRKFRSQYMDAHLNVIVRWDSAPHYEGLSTFRFHKHSMQDVEAYSAITLLGAPDEITRDLKAWFASESYSI
jgi:hypothetical protein